MPWADHFSGHAAAYAAHRPRYPVALADYLAELAPAHALAWDAGCGSGQLSRLLAGRWTRVVATDASAEQIAHAAPHARIEYRRALAHESGLEAGVVDLATAAQAAHWFDLPRYYAEVRRVARPRAVVALVSYGLISIGNDADAVIEHFHSTLRRYWPPERWHVEHGYRSLPFPFDELDPTPLEMRESWTLADVLAYVETWSAVRALGAAEGRRSMDAFRSELARAWADGLPRPVRWPLALRVGRVAAARG